MAGRKAINETAMTAAERKRRSRSMSKPEINFVTQKMSQNTKPSYQFKLEKIGAYENYQLLIEAVGMKIIIGDIK